jgi:hypothetical protein
MATAKKAPTEKQLAARKKFGEQARARAAERQNKNPETKSEEVIDESLLSSHVEYEEIPEEAPVNLPVGVTQQTIDQPDVGDLIKQIQELKDMQWKIMAGQFNGTDAPSVQNGKLTGVVEKYSTEKGYYPDPRERLSKEPRLARFAFPINFELNWEVSTVEYENIEHVRMREPRFTLELVRIMMDEDTGDATDGRYIICRLLMHEDPEAAMVIARQQGIVFETDDEPLFLNEMRYIRMRDWLIECFFPPKANNTSQRTDKVIDGRLVQFYEKTAEVDSDDTKIDFSKIKKFKF